jgi:hypothetical protein
VNKLDLFGEMDDRDIPLAITWWWLTRLQEEVDAIGRYLDFERRGGREDEEEDEEED